MAMASDDSIRRCRLGEDNVDDCKRESKADGKADYMSGKKPARAGGATKRSAAVRSLQLPDFNREGFDYCTCCSKGVDWCRRGRSARITSNHLLSTGCGEKLLPAHGDCIRGKATTFAGERRRIPVNRTPIGPESSFYALALLAIGAFECARSQVEGKVSAAL
jgi:hypothetical protein